VEQVQLPLFNEGLVDLLTVSSCTLSPIRYGSFIEAKGMDNGLQRASIGKST
jgi:hypothetical protein